MMLSLFIQECIMYFYLFKTNFMSFRNALQFYSLIFWIFLDSFLPILFSVFTHIKIFFRSGFREKASVSLLSKMLAVGGEFHTHHIHIYHVKDESINFYFLCVFNMNEY